jgi:hypothetical protein
MDAWRAVSRAAQRLVHRIIGGVAAGDSGATHRDSRCTRHHAACAERRARELALVSLFPGQREYYLIRSGEVIALHGVTWAEWHPARAGALVIATDTGMLRVLATSLDVVWEHDMNALEPEPREAPVWASRW